jgi:hypothetical protein
VAVDPAALTRFRSNFAVGVAWISWPSVWAPVIRCVGPSAWHQIRRLERKALSDSSVQNRGANFRFRL